MRKRLSSHVTVKKAEVAVILVILATLLAGCAGQKAEPKTMTLRLGHEMPEDHPYHLGSLKFAELVEQKTNGAIKIVVYPNAQLGQQKALGEMVASGQLDFCLTWQGILESYDKNVGVLSLPYLFRDWDHVWKVMDGPIGQELLKPLEAKGIKVLTNFNNGLYNVVSRVPVKSPKDLKGLKLRVQSSPVFVEAGNLLGSVVTPTAFNEVYQALQTGAIDAEIQGPVNVVTSKHYEVAGYTCETKMYYLLEPLWMNSKLFDSLPAKYQKAILEAAHEAAVWQREEAEREEEEDTKFLKENGMVYFTPNRDEWVQALKPLYDNHPEWADMVKKIQEVR